jgi:hypothetical protein
VGFTNELDETPTLRRLQPHDVLSSQHEDLRGGQQPHYGQPAQRAHAL